MRRIFSVSDGWQILALQSVFVIFLEIVAIILASDCLSMMFFKNPPLRVNFLLEYFSIDSKNYILLFYTAAIALTYLLLITTQRSFLIRSARIGYALSTKIFDILGEISYNTYSSIDKANLSSVLVPETQRTASAVIMPAFNLLSKCSMVLAVLGYLFFQFGVSIGWIICFFLPYGLILLLSMRVLRRNGEIFTENQKNRQKVISELYLADKYLFFSNQFESLQSKFFTVNNNLGYILGKNSTLSQLPKYAVEMIIAFGFILANFTFVLSEDSSLLKGENASLLVVAFMKLLPTFQQIYRSVSLIEANYPALENIMETISKTQVSRNSENNVKQNLVNAIVHNSRGFELKAKRIEVHGKTISFNGVKIERGDIVAIVGVSGLGKTTIFENILHLRQDIAVNSFPHLENINQKMGSLKGKVGFSAQTSYFDQQLLVSHLKEQQVLSKERLNKLFEDWQIKSLIEKMRSKSEIIDFYNLSGGQRRKLSLLYAITSNSPLIFLDEPTNDLDKNSQYILKNLIKEISIKRKNIFLIVTHDDMLKKISNKFIELVELQ